MDLPFQTKEIKINNKDFFCNKTQKFKNIT